MESFGKPWGTLWERLGDALEGLGGALGGLRDALGGLGDALGGLGDALGGLGDALGDPSWKTFLGRPSLEGQQGRRDVGAPNALKSIFF